MRAPKRVAELTPLPLVSFVVITKDSATRIRTCLDSIVQVEYPKNRYEIMVVDGGSKDSTREIAKAYGAKVVILEPNGTEVLGFKQGAFSEGRNAGISLANGSIIAFVDDDTTISPDWLKILLRAFEDRNVAAATGVNRVPRSGTRVGKYVAVLPVQHPNPDSLDPMPLLQAKMDHCITTRNDVFLVSTKAGLYRKHLLTKLGGFDEILFESEDPDINAALIKEGYSLAFIPEAIAWHQSRQDLHSFARQQIRGGLGQAHNLEKYPEMFEIRWGIIAVWLSLVLILTLVSVFSTGALLLLEVLILGYSVFLLQYGVRATLRYRDPTMIVGVPLVCAVWQLCWGASFMYGLVIKPRSPPGRTKFFPKLFAHICRNFVRILRSYNRTFIVGDQKSEHKE